MKSSPETPEAGFTLIEVMIAMFILGFIAGGMAMVSIHASRSSTYAQRLTRANTIAGEVLETCRNLPFEKIAIPITETVNGASVAETCTAAPPEPWPAGTVITCTFTGFPLFTRVRTVEYRTSGSATTSFTAAVRVAVSWMDARGQTQRVGVASTISKY